MTQDILELIVEDESIDDFEQFESWASNSITYEQVLKVRGIDVADEYATWIYYNEK